MQRLRPGVVLGISGGILLSALLSVAYFVRAQGRGKLIRMEPEKVIQLVSTLKTGMTEAETVEFLAARGFEIDWTAIGSKPILFEVWYLFGNSMSECRALRFRFQPRKEISFEDWQVQHRTNSSLVLADVIWCGATNYVVVQLANATNINAKLSEEKTNESSAATNLIDIVIKRLNSSNGLWMNGGCPILDLSSNATPQEVVSQAVGKWSLNDGKINNYRIVEARKIDLRYRAGCYAALIDSNLGKKILLFEYIGGARGNWWTRFIDAP